MGQRSRKRGRTGANRTPPTPRQPAPKPLSRSEIKDEEVRATLEPYAPEERPGVLVAAAVFALLLAAGNMIAALAGVEVEGNENPEVGAGILSIILVTSAVGMVKKKYWAILGFQALLALTLVVVSLSLLVASNVEAVLLCVAMLIPCSYLFWKLIRVMARIQMPTRPGV